MKGKLDKDQSGLIRILDSVLVFLALLNVAHLLSLGYCNVHLVFCIIFSDLVIFSMTFGIIFCFCPVTNLVFLAV